MPTEGFVQLHAVPGHRLRRTPEFFSLARVDHHSIEEKEMTHYVAPFAHHMGRDNATYASRMTSGFVARSIEPARCALFKKKPTEVLMDNSSERPDLANIAILGYN